MGAHTGTCHWFAAAPPARCTALWRSWPTATLLLHTPGGSLRKPQRRQRCCLCPRAQADQQSQPQPPPGAPGWDPGYRWATCLSALPDPEAALDEAVRGALGSLGAGAAPPETALLFVASDYAPAYERLVPGLLQRVPSLKHILGSSGFGVIGGSPDGPLEVERAPALSLTLGVLPGVEVTTFVADDASLPDADASPMEWQTLAGVPIDTRGRVSFLLALDPAYERLQDLLAGLDYAYPEAVKLGGLASAATMRGRTAVFCWDAARPDASPHGVYKAAGAVLALHGDLTIEPLIAQGCRPISEQTWVVDQVANNLLLVLTPAANSKGGRFTALEALRRDLSAFEAAERRKGAPGGLAGTRLDLTIALAPVSKPLDQLEPADFLVRNFLGVDKATGGILIGDLPRPGQRVRFMVRDREGAQEDLQAHGLAAKRRALQATMEGKPQAAAFGAVVFTCNGRGQALYGQPHYDSRALASFFPVPSSGFFCNGEIGQVGNTTWLHGFTCAAGILQALPPDDT